MSACPCDPLDWHCIGDYPSICAPHAPDRATPAQSEGPNSAVSDTRSQDELDRAREEFEAEVRESKGARAPTTRPARDDDEYWREGLALGLGGGFMNCPQAYCNAIKVGGNGHVEFGYRKQWFAFHVVIDGGGSRLAKDFIGEMTSEELSGSLTFFTAGAQLMFFPVQQGRIDPYFGGLLGYHRTRVDINGDMGWWDLEDQATLKRGTARVTMGLNVYISKKVGIGPRLDLWLPFRGQSCTQQDSEAAQCDAIYDSGVQQDFDGRAYRRSLPKPRAVTLHLFAIF